jgi:feruloyl esterase
VLIRGQARYSHYGFATVSTDTGHISGPDDVSWALNQPEKLINWGYRAMHGSVEAAKQIVQGYYADEIAASYYSACSNGGRQGLKEIQLYPETFDGVILAAPGWSPPRLSAFMLRQALLNAANTTGRVEADLIGAVVAEMVRQCDAQDGVKDDIISDPFGCNFDFNQLLCTPNSEGACLGAAQVETVQMLYTAYWEAGQCLVQPALSIGADASALARGHNGIGVGPFRYAILNDTDWDPATFTFDDFLKADEINPGQSVADNFDLSPFYERGGKLLIYHGYSDVLIPTSSSIQLYNNIYRSLAPKGVDVASFLRLFLVPGMNHCANSAVAPSHIGGELQTIKGATHSVPGFEDAKHDVVLAMMAWVEEGTAPSDIIATKFKGDAVGEVERQRPLCPYPARARYVGGDVDSPENWQCEMD